LGGALLGGWLAGLEETSMFGLEACAMASGLGLGIDEAERRLAKSGDAAGKASGERQEAAPCLKPRCAIVGDLGMMSAPWTDALSAAGFGMRDPSWQDARTSNAGLLACRFAPVLLLSCFTEGQM
jgi:hypothetical protein